MKTKLIDMHTRNLNTKMLRTLSIIFYSLLFMMGASTPVLSNLPENKKEQEEVKEAMRQFKAIVAFNEKCEKEGNMDKAIFFITYRPGQTLNLEEYYDCGGSWFKYNRIATTDVEMFPTVLCDFLNDKLQAFNNPTQGAWTNPDNITLYSFHVNFMKLAIQASPEDMLQSNILEYLSTSIYPADTAAVISFLGEVKTQKAKTFNFQGNDNTVLVYGISAQGKYWKDKKRAIGVFNSYPRGSCKSSVLARKKYRNEKFETRTYPHDFDIPYKTQKKYINAVLSNIEYFTDASIRALYDCIVSIETPYTGEEDCAGLQALFCDEKAIAFIESRCSIIDNASYTEIKQYTYNIAKYIQDNAAWFDDFYANVADPYDYAYYGAILEDYVGWYNAIMTEDQRRTVAYAKLDEALAANDWHTVYITMFYYFPRNSYYRNLSVQQRFDIIKVLMEGPLYGGGNLLSLHTENHEGELVKVIKHFSGPPADIQIFLDNIEYEEWLLEDLFTKLHDIGGPDNFTSFADEMSKLVLRRHGINRLYTPLTLPPLVTKNYIWIGRNFNDAYVKYDQSGVYTTVYDYLQDNVAAPIYPAYFDIDNSLKFRQNVCTARQIYAGTTNAGSTLPPTTEETCPDSLIETETLRPFEVIALTNLGKISFLKECNGQCKGETILMPAIKFAYLLNQQRSKKNFDDAMLILNVASLAIGVGELSAAVRLANASKMRIAGWALGADILDIGISSQGFQTWFTTQYDEDAYLVLQIFSMANLTGATFTGLYDMQKAADAVVALEKSRQNPAIYNNMPLTPAEKAGLEARENAFRVELEKSPQGQELLVTARTSAGIFSPGLINKMDEILPTGDFPTLRQGLETKLNSSVDLLTSFNAQPNLVRAWKSIAEHPQMGDLINSWDVAKYDKLFEDLKDNAHLIDKFSENPILVKAWEVFHTTDVIPLELKLNGERLDDLARYLGDNPNNVDLIRSELVLAANVEQYLDYIKYVGTDLEDFYSTFKLYGYLSNQRSWSWYLNNLNTKSHLRVGLPPFDGKSYEEVLELVLESSLYSNMNKSDAYMTFSYTTNYFYGTVNRWIRDAEETALRTTIINGAVESLSKLPQFSPNTTFYRGIKITDEVDLQSFLSRYTVGENVPEQIFQSVAVNIDDSFIGRPGYNIEIEIKGKLNVNSECRDVHDFAMGKYWNQPDNRTLTEGVFLPGTAMRVIEVTPLENGVFRFILQEL